MTKLSGNFINLKKKFFRFSEKVCKLLHKLIMNLKCFVKFMKITREFVRDYLEIIINLGRRLLGNNHKLREETTWK